MKAHQKAAARFVVAILTFVGFWAIPIAINENFPYLFDQWFSGFFESYRKIKIAGMAGFMLTLSIMFAMYVPFKLIKTDPDAEVLSEEEAQAKDDEKLINRMLMK